MSIEFGNYSVQPVGKYFKNTKQKHIWKFKYGETYYEVKALESKFSGKFRVMVQND